jgi:hypothetical protein
MEGDGAASGITETINLTGGPRPASGQELVDETAFLPVVETWARTEVLSML